MEGSLIDSMLGVCNALNKNSVQYLVVGGTAVALHGYFRFSSGDSGELLEKPDIDVWYNPSYPNYFRLLNAIEELGNDVAKFRQETTPDPARSFFKYKFEDFTLDLLPTLKVPVKFKDAFERKKLTSIATVEIPFIGLDDLIHDKLTNPRAKDIEDIDHLKKLRNK